MPLPDASLASEGLLLGWLHAKGAGASVQGPRDGAGGTELASRQGAWVPAFLGSHSEGDLDEVLLCPGPVSCTRWGLD